MKTLGRVLFILAAFALVMGIMYVVVNADAPSSSTSVPVLQRGGEGLPGFSGERPEFGGESREGIELFGLLKNTGIVALIVALVTVPKSLMRRKAIPVPINRS